MVTVIKLGRRYGVYGLAVLSILICVVSLGFDPGFLFKAFSPIVFFLLLSLFVLFGWELIKWVRSEDLKRGLLGLAPSSYLLVALLFIFQWVHSDYGYKEVPEQYADVARSLSMYENRSIHLPERLLVSEGQQVLLDEHVGGGSLVYPFVLSLVHTFIGYHPWNAFLLNTLLWLLLNVLVFLLGRGVFRSGGGELSVVLLSSLPLVGWLGSGAGPQIFQGCLFAMVMWLTMQWTQKGKSGGQMLVVYAILFMSYQSVAALVFLAVPLVFLYREKPDGGRGPLILSLAILPLFMLPLITQLRLGEYGSPSFDNLSVNLGNAVLYLLDFQKSSSNSLLISIIGGGCLLMALSYCFWAVKLLRDSVFSSKELWSLWCALLIIYTMSVLAFEIDWKGGSGEGSLFLLLLVMTISPVWLMGRAKVHPNRWRFAIGMGVVYLIGYTAPQASMCLFGEDNYPEREIKYALGCISEYDPEELMIISSESAPWTVYGYQSIGFRRSREVSGTLRQWLGDGGGRCILVVQAIKVDSASGMFIPELEEDLLGVFELEELGVFMSRPFEGVRVSRVLCR